MQEHRNSHKKTVKTVKTVTKTNSQYEYDHVKRAGLVAKTHNTAAAISLDQV